MLSVTLLIISATILDQMSLNICVESNSETGSKIFFILDIYHFLSFLYSICIWLNCQLLINLTDIQKSINNITLILNLINVVFNDFSFFVIKYACIRNHI